MAKRRTPTIKLTDVYETDLEGLCEVWFVRHGEQVYDFMTSPVAQLVSSTIFIGGCCYSGTVWGLSKEACKIAIPQEKVIRCEL